MIDISFRNFVIFKDQDCFISNGEPWWWCIHECWMYDSKTFIGLLWTIITEWKNDKYLIG